MAETLIYPMQEKYEDYLSDESKMAGRAASISFPQTEDEITQIIAQMSRSGIPITIQGARTGTAAGAVPLEGHLLNLSKMNRVKQLILTDEGETLLKVEPGITLLELKNEIKHLKTETELFWPPDPTETSATVGGIASCNAKGISAHLYGETREHIAGARVALSNGVIKEMKRGETFLPFCGGQKDLLDLFLGGEGLFGILTELTLKLQPKPKEIWGFLFFFEKKEELFSFADNLTQTDLRVEGAALAAAEYLDRAALDLIEERKAAMSSLKKIPDIDAAVTAVICLEVHSRTEEAIEKMAENLINLAVNSNCDPDRAWALCGKSEVEKLRALRHAAAEGVNIFTGKVMRLDRRITKLEAYMRAGDKGFRSVIKKYEDESKAAGLNASIFGHIYQNHYHVNLLTESYEQFEKGQKLLEKWAKELAGRQGKIETQHGVGKLKRAIFLKMAPPEYIREIRKLKQTFDSISMWNPDNMI